MYEAHTQYTRIHTEIVLQRKHYTVYTHSVFPLIFFTLAVLLFIPFELQLAGST